MKRLVMFAGVMILVSSGLPTEAQRPVYYRTGDLINGRGWNNASDEMKLGYLLGVRDGSEMIKVIVDKSSSDSPFLLRPVWTMVRLYRLLTSSLRNQPMTTFKLSSHSGM